MTRTPAITSAILMRLRRERALTGGLGVSKPEIEGIYAAELATARSEAIERTRMAEAAKTQRHQFGVERKATIKQGRFDRATTLAELRLKKQALDDQKDAAKISGAVQVAGTAANMGLTYKLLAGETAKTTAATYTGATKTVEGVQFYQLSDGTWSATAGNAGATAPTTTAGGGATVGNVAGAAGAGLAGGFVGAKIGQTRQAQKFTPVGGEKTESALGGAAGGAAAGAAYGTMGGLGAGWGTVIGAIVGGTYGYGDASGWW